MKINLKNNFTAEAQSTQWKRREKRKEFSLFTPRLCGDWLEMANAPRIRIQNR